MDLEDFNIEADKMGINRCIEPNRNAEAYRNFIADNYTARLERYLDFLEINDDGCTILGCSDLSGRFWYGSVWCFPDASVVPDVEKSLAGTTCETGVTDAKFLSDKTKFVVGEDSGAMHILVVTQSPEDNSYHISALATVSEHDESVSSLSIFRRRNRVVSGSADYNIKLWNVETLECEHTYRPAHEKEVTCVAAHPGDNDCVFGSCSSDSKAYVWDTRKSKSATLILKGEECFFTSIAWQPDKPSVAAIGSTDGMVTLVDVRQTRIPLFSVECSKRLIHRLRFSEQQPSWVAMCADDTNVSVLDCSTQKIILNRNIQHNFNISSMTTSEHYSALMKLRLPAYHKLSSWGKVYLPLHLLEVFNILSISNSVLFSYNDGRHDDMVRGLAWDPNTGYLHSCGWDKKVLVHSPVFKMEQF